MILAASTGNATEWRKNEVIMKFAILTLASLIAPLGHADGVKELPLSQTYLVTHYASAAKCDIEKMRNPSSSCKTHPQAIPEQITIKFSKDKTVRHFELKSSCRTMQGTITTDAEETLHWRSTSLIDHCGNLNLSLMHDAVFSRILETDRLVRTGDSVQAQSKAKIDLTFKPMDAKLAVQ
jgi:hypothetical protein